MASPYINSVSFGNQPPAAQLGALLQPQVDFNTYGAGSGSGGQPGAAPSGGGVGDLLKNKAVNKLLNKGVDKLLGLGAAAPQTYGSLGALGGTPSGLGQYGSLTSAGAAPTSAFGLGGTGAIASPAIQGLGASLAPAAGAPGTFGGLGSLGGTSSGLGQLGSLGSAAPTSEAAASLGSALGAGSYSASPAVLEAMNAAIPDAAGAAGAGAGASSAGVGAAGATMAVAAPIAFLAGLYLTALSDKRNSSPMAQMSVLASNGPMEAQLAQNMIAIASKYGDPQSVSAWDQSKWSPADLAAVNNGHATNPILTPGMRGSQVSGRNNNG